MTLPKSRMYGFLPYVLIGAGLVGLIASFALTYDKLHVLQNPNYIPACNINPIFSCGSVMKTEQASFLGMPNTIFGLVAFTMLLLFGIIVASGTTLKRWIWLGAQAAATLGVVAVHYLFFQSVFRIGAICIWCLSVWVVTIPLFWCITLYNFGTGHLKLPVRFKKVGALVWRYQRALLAMWMGILALIILKEFWYYWETLL